jgi:hypothetical protein
MSKKVNFFISMQPELGERIRAAAKAEQRSLSNFMAVVLSQYMNGRIAPSQLTARKQTSKKQLEAAL